MQLGKRPPVQNRLQAWRLFSPQTMPKRYTLCYPEPGLSPVPSRQFSSPPSFVPISPTWFLPERAGLRLGGIPLSKESCAGMHLVICVLICRMGIEGVKYAMSREYRSQNSMSEQQWQRANGSHLKRNRVPDPKPLGSWEGGGKKYGHCGYVSFGRATQSVLRSHT